MQNYYPFLTPRFHKKHYNFHFLHKSFVLYKNMM